MSAYADWIEVGEACQIGDTHLKDASREKLLSLIGWLVTKEPEEAADILRIMRSHAQTNLTREAEQYLNLRYQLRRVA